MHIYKPYFLIILTALVGGAIGAASKIALREIPPLSFTLLRFLLAGIVLLPLAIKQKELTLKDSRKIFLVSLLATANIVLFIFGLQRTTATISQMLYAVVPLLAGIFSFFILREKISPKNLAGIIIGFIGVLIIVLLPVIGTEVVFNGDLMGNIFILIGAVSFALYSVVTKKFQHAYSPLQITLFFVLTTIVTQTILAPIDLQQHPGWWSSVSTEAILALAYVGVFGTGIYYLIFQHVIRSTTPVIASMILYLQPVFTFLWAWVLLGEKVTLEFMAGAALTFIGVALVTSSQKYG